MSTAKNLALVLLCLLAAIPAFARSKRHSAVHQGVVELDALLKAGDVAGAQSLAGTLYQQSGSLPATPSSDPSVIIDPALATESSEHLQRKAAVEIAETFYKYGELESAKTWAETANVSGSVSNAVVRRARVLLGKAAMAMDRDDEAIGYFTSIITDKNQYREQPEAYAGLLELLMLQKQDDLVEQWVRYGQQRFEGAGGLELDFLRQAAKTLKRRNHPLWNEIDRQVVDLTANGGKGRLQALRELASNARKFGRYAEAETNYTAICGLPLKGAEETVNAHLFLAECQVKQGKDYSATVQNLTTKSTKFTNFEEREYASYRIAKFYESQGNLDSAAASYQLLASSSSTSTWAAASLHQLGALKEKQGDLQGALQLYLEYPQRFPGNDRLVLQSYASALNVADTLGDTNTANQVASTISAKAATVQDYNVHLNLAYHFKKKSLDQVASGFLETGLRLAQRQLARVSSSDDHVRVHFRVMRRLVDFGESQRILDYHATCSSDCASASDAVRYERYQVEFFKIFGLLGIGRSDVAVMQCRAALEAVGGDSQLAPQFAEVLGQLICSSGGGQEGETVLIWAADRYPNSPWSSCARLYLAVDRYNKRQTQDALRLADEILATSQPSAKMKWVRDTYWQASYLRGRASVRLGQVAEGERIASEALQACPSMPIRLRLTTP